MMDYRENAGYIITDSCHVGDSEFVLGVHLTAPQQFVTWKCSNRTDYDWGHYFSDLFSAQKDLVARAQEEVQCLEEQRQNTIAPEAPPYSPWGKVQECETLCPGVYSVSTPGHGGVMVRRELAEKVFRKEAMGCGFIASGYLCFEEDNDAQVALRELMDKKMIQAPVNGRFAPGAYEAVINSSVQIQDNAQEILQMMEKNSRNMLSLSRYSRSNAVNQEWTEMYLDEAHTKGVLPVRCHCNVIAWAEDAEEFRRIRNDTGSQLAMMECTPRYNTVDTPVLYWAGIPGNAGDFPAEESFYTFLEQAVCLFAGETNYRSSPSPFGIRMADRQNGIPVHVDISDLPMKRGIITNRNKFILGPSGSGKSFFTNHLVRNYYEQGAHILLVDTGNSYQGLCRMIHERTRGGDGIYITYEEDNPISFNPFYTDSGQFDVEKRESIKTLILTLWKREDEAPKRSEEVALSGAVNAYIRKITGNREARPDFNGFYEFVDGDYRRMIAEKKVREKDFDIDGFLNVLEPFYKGGDYDFLLNSDKELDLTNRRFIVFELDNISGNKVLLPVVTLIIMETFIAKMRRLKGIRKVILIEECWKALMSANMSGYIQYLFKTVRKYFGEAVVVTQEVDDIISSPIVKEAIINNSDCKILLDQRKYMNKFEHIQRLLGLTEKEKSQILSINQANHPGRFYREVWIGLGGTRSAVYATEVSAEEYFTFTTEESEKLEVQRLAEVLDGNLELAIRRMAERKREEQRQVSTPKREQ